MRSDGLLLGVASCRPPPWIKTPHAAELWAVFTALEAFSPPPRIVTDCQSIWKTATLGEERASRLTRHMATVWMRIAARLTRGCRRLSLTET